MVLRKRTRQSVTLCENCNSRFKTIFCRHRGYINAHFSLKYNCTAYCKNLFVCRDCTKVTSTLIRIWFLESLMTFSSVRRLMMRNLPAVAIKVKYNCIIILSIVFQFYFNKQLYTIIKINNTFYSHQIQIFSLCLFMEFPYNWKSKSTLYACDWSASRAGWFNTKEIRVSSGIRLIGIWVGIREFPDPLLKRKVVVGREELKYTFQISINQGTIFCASQSTTEHYIRINWQFTINSLSLILVWLSPRNLL